MRFIPIVNDQWMIYRFLHLRRAITLTNILEFLINVFSRGSRSRVILRNALFGLRAVLNESRSMSQKKFAIKHMIMKLNENRTCIK